MSARQLISETDRRYRSLFRVTLFLLILFSLVFIATTAVFFYYTLLQTSEVCHSQACIQASSRILENIDVSVDPCEDFHQFSCGSFIQNQRIPQDQSKFDVFDILKQKLAYFVSDILASQIDSIDIEATVKAKRLYRSCMNEDQVNQNGEAEFIQIIGEYFGGWPILQQTAQNMTIMKKLLTLRKYGFRPLIDIKITPNPKNPRGNILRLKQPSWLFNQQYYVDKKFELAYKEYLTKFASYLNPGLTGRIEDQVSRVFEMEKAIAMMQVDNSVRTRDYTNMTIKSLSETIPNFKWNEFIIEGIFTEIADLNVTETEPIIVYDIDFVKAVCDFLADPKNDRNDIDNLIVWSSIRKEVLFLPKKYKDAKLSFDQVFRGAVVEEPRDEICAFLTLGAMEYAVGRLYVSKYFDKKSKEATTDMIEIIRDEFMKILNESKWLDEKSRHLALDKARFIESKVGYPEFMYNDTYMNQLYETYELNETEYLRNSLQIMRIEVNKGFLKLRQSKDEGWITGPAIVNAFYSSYSNQICLPAGILQAPFYDPNYPNYLNYGGIGSVIGHEITHGFDERGRLHDKNGVLYPDGETSLWTKKTIDSYKKKVQCIIDQYSDFKVDQINETLNGEKTLGENIADNGGLKEAFRAYQVWVSKNGPEPLLPGLKYNQNQLFFINNAQIWCSKYRDQYLKYQVLSANHSPGQFRINGPTSNSEDFAKVFNCKPNQKNNPTQKCSVW